MEKKTAIFGFLILGLVLLSSLVSAYSFFDFSESWFYNENLVGNDRGFSLTYETSIPQIDTTQNSPIDWSYSGYRRNYNDPYINQRNANYFDSARYRYNADRALNNAFRTFQSNSRQQLQNERQRESERNRYRYSYGYGFSSYRPIHYYW